MNFQTKVGETQKKTDNISDLHSGFTEGRIITDNLYFLKYCTNQSYRRKQELIVTSFDI